MAVAPDPVADAARRATADAFLREMFEAMLGAADPRRSVARALGAPPATGRVVVVGAGKAAAAMAGAVEAAWPDAPLRGVVVVPDGHGMPAGAPDAPARIAVREAGHPVPDARGLAAGRAVLDAVRGLDRGDLVVALLSGGASSLLVAPRPGVRLADKRAVGAALLASGAPIAEINRVRTALSAIKGGGLARACRPARVWTLAISDVAGDAPWAIGSGPTRAAPGATDPDRAAAEILSRRGIAPPPRVARLLAAARGGAAATFAEPGAAASRDRFAMLATAFDGLAAAAREARRGGVAPLILGDRIEADAAELGRAMAGIARSVSARAAPLGPPAVLLSGGEASVRIPPGCAGAGGRNLEFLLSLALALEGEAGISAIACDTDGIDGDSGAAGAVVRPDTLARMRAAGIDPAEALARHDSATAFRAVGDLIVTGPTRTNVNDFRAVLVRPDPGAADPVPP